MFISKAKVIFSCFAILFFAAILISAEKGKTSPNDSAKETISSENESSNDQVVSDESTPTENTKLIPQKLFDDPRIIKWSADFLAGKREQVLLDVETDLKSPNPHPFAPHIWTQIQTYRGTLDKSLAEIKDVKLLRDLHLLSEIVELYSNGEYSEILKRYPINTTKQITDPWVLHYLSFAASRECRYDEALSYATRLARIYPDYFQPGWTISTELIMKERIRPKITAIFGKAGELGNTNVGRFIRHELEHLPTNAAEDEDDLAQVNLWLEQFPLDARASRRKGFTLRRLGKSDEALLALKKALEDYPFISQNYQEIAVELFKQAKPTQAEKLIRDQANLRTGDAKAADQRFEELRAQILIDAGKKQDAYEILSWAVQKYPQSAELAALYSRTLSAYPKAEESLLFYARQAARLEPNSFKRQKELVEALKNVGLANEAWELFVEIDKKFLQKSESLFWTAHEILSQTLEFDEQIRLTKKAVAEFPESVSMRQLYAFVLAQNGDYAEALNVLRLISEIEAPADWTLKVMRQLEIDLLKEKPENFEKELQSLKTRFSWRTFPPLSEKNSENPLPISFADIRKDLSNLDESQLRSTLTNSLSNISNIPRLRVQLETFNEEGVFDFSYDDRYLVSSIGKSVVFWDVASGKVTDRVSEDKQWVNALRFLPNSKLFATASSDGTVKIWDAQTHAVVRTFEGFAALGGDSFSLAFDQDGTRLYVMSYNEKGMFPIRGWYHLSAWDLSTGSLLWTQKHPYIDDSRVSLEKNFVSQKGQMLGVNDVFQRDSNGSMKSLFSIYDTRNGQRIKGIDATEIAFRENGELVTFNNGAKKEANIYLHEQGENTSLVKRKTITNEKFSSFDFYSLSPNGRNIFLGNQNGDYLLLDIDKEQIVQSWKLNDPNIHTIKWSPNSKYLLTTSAGEWKDFGSVSTNGSYRSTLLSILSDKPIWTIKTEVSKSEGEDFEQKILRKRVPGWGTFSATGELLIYGGQFADSLTNQVITETGGTAGEIQFVAISPDNGYLWATTEFYEYEEENEKNEKVVVGNSYGAFDLLQSQILPNRYAVSNDVNQRALMDSKNRLISFSSDENKGRFQLQSVNSEKPTDYFGTAASGKRLSLSADGQIALTNEGSKVVAWDLAGKPKIAWQLETNDTITAFAISSDKKKLATASTYFRGDLGDYSFLKGNKKFIPVNVKIWDLDSGKVEKTLFEQVIRFEFPENEQVYKVFDTNGKRLEVEEIQRLEDLSVFEMKFSPDGKFLVCASGEGKGSFMRGIDDIFNKKQVEVWNLATGKMLFETPSGTYATFAFSADSQYLVTGGMREGEVSRVWQVTDGKLMRVLPDTSYVSDIKLAPDGKSFLIVHSEYGEGTRIEIWDVIEGKKRGTIYLFDDKTWAVIDSEGRYDSSNSGDNPNLYYVVGTDVIQVAQLKQRYYEPKLLSKLFSFNKEPTRDVAAFKDVKPYPSAELKQPAPNSGKTTLTVTNRGGGIGKIEVYVNDSLKEDAIPRGSLPNPKQEKFVQEIDLAQFQRFMLPGENKITVKTYNEEGYLASRGTSVFYILPPEKVEPPALWALFVGVSDYAEGGTLQDLKFAAIDAENMAKAFTATSGNFFPDRTNIRVLTTLKQKPEEQPTKENIERILREFADKEKGAKANDVLMLYFAGHGVSFLKADNSDDFYFLTKDARTGDLKDQELRKSTALSGEEIATFIGDIAANKKVMILDTCASGRFIEKINESRTVDSSTIRAWDRMKDRQGLWILAGSAANAVSYESSRYGQGVLTYSLLQGMYRDFAQVTDKAENNKFELLDVSKLFQYSRDNVPDLAKGIGGIQKPMIASKKDASSFHIGRLDDQSRVLVPYTQEKPVYLRSDFSLQSRPVDELKLTVRINEKLNQEMTRGLDAKLVYWESVPQFAGAYQIAGRYEINDTTGEVKVTVYLFSFALDGNDFKIVYVGKSFVITGEKSQPDKLVTDILAAADKVILELPKTK